MKIISVHIHNIASIEGPCIINLEEEPLKSSGLFAITGVTGAGKSTILDAICLALYNNTPRLASFKGSVAINDGVTEISVNNVKNLLRKGATSGYAKVTFLATDSKIYEAEWHIRKARNKSGGSIQNETIHLTNITDNEVFNENRKTLVLEKIKQLVGLSFDEFTKSVILAQGDFTSFLKANDDKRSDILEKLTGTEIYTQISKKIHEKNKELNSELDYLIKQLNTMDFLSEDEEKDIENQLVSFEKKEKEIKEDLTILQQKEKWFEDKKQIEDQINSFENQLNTAISEKNSKSEEFLELEMIERFQSIKSEVVHLENEKEKLQKITKEIENITNQLKKITDLEEKNTILSFQNSEKLKNIQELFEKSSDEIENAKKIDIIIEEKKKNVDNKQKNVENKQKNISEIEKNIENVFSRYVKGQKFIENEQKWLEEHNNYAKLNENYYLIHKIIPENELLSSKLSKIKIDLEEKNTKVKQLTNEISFQKEIIKSQKEIFDKNKSEIDELKQKISSFDSNLLNENRKKYTQLYENYKNDSILVENIEKISKEIEELTKKITISEENYDKNKNLLTELEQKKKELEIQYEVTERLYQKTYLENSDNIIFLRQNLVEGEECPVCGSCSHPNSHKIISESLLKTIGEERQNVKETLDEVSKKCIALESSQNTENQRITDKKSQFSELKKNNEKTLLLLQKSEKYEEYPSQNIQKYIGEKLSEISSILNQIEADFQAGNKLQNALTELQNEAENYQKTLTEITEKGAFLEAEKQKYENEIILLSSENQHIINQLKQYSEQIGYLYLDQKWLDLWHSNISEFKAEMEKAVNIWQSKNNQLALAKEKWVTLERELTNLDADIQQVRIEFQQLNQEFLNEKEQLDLLIFERKKLLNGENAFLFEKRFKDDIHLIINQLEELKNEKNSFNIEKATYEAQRTELQKSYGQTIKVISELEKNVISWISDNYPEKASYILSKFEAWKQLSESWLESQKEVRNGILENILKIQTILDEKRQNLQKHLSKQEILFSLEEIKEFISEKNTFLEEITSKIQLNRTKIAINKEKKQTISKIIKEKEEKERIFAKWKLLNDLIGSSSGSVFRKYAQEYTLDILLRYANVHIKNINKRYTLERIANSLSIQVIDHDMGEEIRSVYSLSGGESFLVSLALALALSSISSMRMNIETLFIDEGFGTLDIETLTMALDALESLQSQGKKVGVISHVQEMVERIPVKIVVKKEGYGKSKVEIV